jgi:hypothetical protein
MAIACRNWTTGASSAFAAEGGDSSASLPKDLAISYQARPMRSKRAAHHRIRVTARFRRKGRNDKNSSASKIEKLNHLAVAFVFPFQQLAFPPKLI